MGLLHSPISEGKTEDIRVSWQGEYWHAYLLSREPRLAVLSGFKIVVVLNEFNGIEGMVNFKQIAELAKQFPTKL